MTLTVLPASAEWFAGLYLGAAITPDADVTVRSLGKSVTVEGEFDTSFSGGVRVGYWFGTLPWLGLAVDASAFAPNSRPKGSEIDEHTEIVVVPVSALLMLRWPRGPIRPYIAAGPGAFISTAEEDLPGEKISDTSVDLGLDARAGVAWDVTEWITVFVEGRYTRRRPDFEGVSDGAPFSIEPELDSYHALAGVSFRF